MSRNILLVSITTLLLTIATSTPASAIPSCPSGTMADYIGFGAAGCQFNSLTFSNFSYSGSANDLFGPSNLPAPPSAIAVQPRSDPGSLGSGGAGLEFTSPPTPPGFFRVYWGNVAIGFDVTAKGSGIVGDDLSGQLQSIANLQSAALTETAVPGGSLTIVQGTICFDPFFRPPSCANPRNLSFPATDFQEITIGGENINSFETGFAAPEPTTLLLWGTTMAGLGLAARRSRRRQR